MAEWLTQDLLTMLTDKEIDFNFLGNLQLPVHGVCNVINPKPNSLCFWARHGIPPHFALDESNLLVALKPPGQINLFHRNTIFVDDPYLAFICLARVFEPSRTTGIHDRAILSPDTVIGKDVSIGANSVIGPNVSIGDNVLIQENCVIKDCRIGNNVEIYPGVVIGCAGLGTRKDKSGSLHLFPHFGRVLISDDVVIQDLTSILRGSLNDTFIGRGVHIAGKCRIGPGVKIGENTIIIQCSTVGASTVIGLDVFLGMDCCLRDGVTIGDGAYVGMGAVVVKNVPARELWFGNPARFVRRNC